MTFLAFARLSATTPVYSGAKLILLLFSAVSMLVLYVQQRIQENAEEFYGWLQDGAHVYVCGDADRMAKDVDAALHDVIARVGGLDAAAAHSYVNDMIKSHRYVRDVY